MKKKRIFAFARTRTALAALALILIWGGCRKITSGGDTKPPLTGAVSIDGAAKVGADLTANFTQLEGAGTISYRWRISADNAEDSYEDIAAGDYVDSDETAAKPSYRPALADAGKYIRLTVNRAGYSGSATSEFKGPVLIPGSAVITGNPKVDAVLSASTVDIPEGLTPAYQWQISKTEEADGEYERIEGATSIEYTPDNLYYAGRWLKVKLTLSGAAAPETKFSPAFGPLGKRDLTGAVSVNEAKAEVEEALSANADALAGLTTIYYQWQISGSADGNFADIPDAAEPSYTPPVDYVNKWLRLKVTREWYAGSKESAALQILPVVTGVNITTTTEDVGRNTTRTFKAEVVGKGAPLPQGVTWSIADKDDNPIAWASISSNGVLSVASNAPTGETITVTAVSEFAPEHSRAVEVAVVADFLWLQPEAEDAPVIGNKAGGFIAYGNDIFLLIGEGSVYHSEDGISWELKDASFDKDFYFLEGSDIKCINGRFFGETSDGLSYSTDGTSWEPASGLDADFQVFSAAFGKDLFVAVGNEGKVAWSLEGEDWTQLENEKLPFYEHGFIGNSTIIGNIAFGNGRFVALGESGEFSYSGDGTNWTRPTMQQVFTSQLPQGPGYNGPKITGLAFGNGKFVAVNKSGEVAWSENGENEESWDEVRDTKFSGSTINAIAFGGGKFLAAGADGRAAYSTNGNEWVDVSVPGGVDFDTHGIAYGNGRFVVVSDTGKIAYSNLQE